MIWDEIQRRYEDDLGRPFTPAQIRKEIEDFIASEQREVEREAQKLLAGSIVVAAFFLFMREKISAWHGIAGVIAYGGQEQMNPERWARINEKVSSELKYLAEFEQAAIASFEAVEAIAKEALIGGQIVNRSSLYVDSAYATFANNEAAREFDNGVTLGRRLTEEDGNVCNDCEAASSEEFVPLDELPEIGDSQCQNACRCQFEFLVGDVQFATSELFGGRISGQPAYGGDVEVS